MNSTSTASRDQQELVITHINIRLATKPAGRRAANGSCGAHGDRLETWEKSQQKMLKATGSIVENQISSEWRLESDLGEVPAWHCPPNAASARHLKFVYSRSETWIKLDGPRSKASGTETKNLTHLSKISRTTNTCLTFHVRRIIATTDHQLCQKMSRAKKLRGPGPRAQRRAQHNPLPFQSRSRRAGERTIMSTTTITM